MSRITVPRCYAWLRRGLQKLLRGIREGGGGEGGTGRQSGLLTTFVSIIIFFVFYFFAFYSNHFAERVKVDGTTAAAFTERDQPNRTWMERRKLLLEKKGSLAKVVIFSYMRGGSTLFSDIFNQDPKTDVMWHEPMDSFYQYYAGFEAHSIPLTIHYNKNFTRRFLDDTERDETTNYLENLLNCRPENLPIETLTHFHMSYSSAFKPLHKCMEARKAKEMTLTCKKPLRPICGFSDLIRRDMSVSLDNKCPQLIRAFKSMRNMGHFLVQRLIVESAEATRNASLSPLNGSWPAELTGGAIAQLSGDIYMKKKHNMQLLAQHQLCLSRIRPTVKSCLRMAAHICHQAMMTTLKLIRTMLEDLEATIQRIPDIHVIYYVRDPRAIATSRTEDTTRLTMSPVNRTTVDEARILCRRMTEDVKAKRRFEARYPGSVVTIRYENFVLSPLQHVREIFERIGRPVPSNIVEWIRTKFSGARDNGIYGTVRANPVMTSLKWMTQTSRSDGLLMDEYCGDVLREFGYLTFRQMRVSEKDGGVDSSPDSLATNEAQNDKQ